MYTNRILMLNFFDNAYFIDQKVDVMSLKMDPRGTGY
jgi:hypothetical protein